MEDDTHDTVEQTTEAPVKKRRGRRKSDASTIAEAVEQQNTTSTRGESSSSRDPSFVPAPEDAPLKPRLMINKIVLENFKSYAGRKEIGPFHSMFSAVVGPNGSGKSNLIDALLFVFGKRTKKLRFNKLAELIHNSNEHGREIAQAKVEIHFQQIIDRNNESGEYEVIEGSQFQVSRVATSSNVSSYYIDDRKVTFNEAQDLLMSHGIDLNNNRFLILQGEVEQISMMKPKAQSPHEDGLLEYIEDIIGTNQYIEQIEAAQSKYDDISLKRSQQLARVKASAKARDGLEDAKEEAESYVKKEREVIDKSALIQLKKRSTGDNKLKKIDKQSQGLEKQLNEQREALSGARKELEDLKAEFAKETQEKEALSKELKGAHDSFMDFKRKCERFKQDIKHCKTKIKKLQSTIDSEEANIQASNRTSRENQALLDNHQAQLDEQQAELERNEEEINTIRQSITAETASLRAEIEKLKNKLIPKQQKVNKVESKISGFESELSVLVSERDGKRNELETAKTSLTTTQAEVEQSIENVNSLQQEKSQLASSIPEIQREIQKLVASEQKLGDEFKELRRVVEDAKETKKQSASQSRALQMLMTLQDEHNVGIYGRLGDLGAIDPRYDAAIRTTSALNNIVVQTENDAKFCVEFLRAKELGVQTFVILDKVSNLTPMIDKFNGAPEGVPRLFDLIQSRDPRFLCAFYYAVRDTLVAENMEQATRIAFGAKRFRVVTLNGEVIEMSGTMSGGGGGKSRAQGPGMGSRLQEAAMPERELKQKEKQLNKVYEDLTSLRAKKSSLEHQLQQLLAQQSTIDMSIERAQHEINGKKKLADELQKITIPQLQSSVKKDRGNREVDENIERLQQTIAGLQEPLERAKADARVLSDQIQQKQKEIMDAGGMRMKELVGRIDGLNLLIENNKNAISRANVQLKTEKKNVVKSGKTIETAKKEQASSLQEYEEKKVKLTEIAEAAAQVSQKYEEAQAVLDQKEQSIKKVEKKYNKCNENLKQASSLEIDLTNQIDNLKRTQKELQDAIHQADRNITELTEQKKRYVLNESEDLKLPSPSADDLARVDVEYLKSEIARLQDALQQMAPNLGAIMEYREKQQEFQQRTDELQLITQELEQQLQSCEELRKKRLDEFVAGFTIINMKLREMYRTITLGGDAELEFNDKSDPFAEGISFSVRPPKKSWKNIANLSGGEKTLSSLSLVFALHHYKPTPLYFMDEIDAALDFKNVSIVAHYIKERTKNAQFIIISLRNNMFELSDRLVGIYKTNNATKSVAINPSSFHIPTSSSSSSSS